MYCKNNKTKSLYVMFTTWAAVFIGEVILKINVV
jgi:hypothetical protein